MMVPVSQVAMARTMTFGADEFIGITLPLKCTFDSDSGVCQFSVFNFLPRPVH
ncbi:MAG: hypothetical protein N2246_04620 [Candidatus Sumerlaeia bacterium]|nr:hypothetical protein [Candidatus Sumerlaeia bacterium]